MIAFIRSYFNSQFHILGFAAQKLLLLVVQSQTKEIKFAAAAGNLKL